jgi:alkylation response protein AidB-like acyl-CoA dehydrogenase
VIRHKIAEMSHRVEALHALTEQVTYQMKQGVPSASLGGSAALLKVNASKCFEFCAREASQIFGGASYVQGEGQGVTVERLYREVRRKTTPHLCHVLVQAVHNSPTRVQTNAQRLA